MKGFSFNLVGWAAVVAMALFVTGSFYGRAIDEPENSKWRTGWFQFAQVRNGSLIVMDTFPPYGTSVLGLGGKWEAQVCDLSGCKPAPEIRDSLLNLLVEKSRGYIPGSPFNMECAFVLAQAGFKPIGDCFERNVVRRKETCYRILPS